MNSSREECIGLVRHHAEAKKEEQHLSNKLAKPHCSWAQLLLKLKTGIEKKCPVHNRDGCVSLCFDCELQSLALPWTTTI